MPKEKNRIASNEQESVIQDRWVVTRGNNGVLCALIVFDSFTV